METERIEKGAPKLYGGLVVFAVVILFLIFAAAPMQMAWGMTGLLLTELGILACGVIPVFIFRYDIKKALSVRLPKLRQVFGVLLLWLGALFVGYLFIYLTILLAPKEMTALTQEIGGFLTGIPFLLSLGISALAPAVCEEALCRGFIQYSFSGLKSKWVTILLVGILFGLMHLSPLRFAQTMILGFVLAYVMVETRNLILPAIMHFVHNAVPLAITYLALPGAPASADTELLSGAAVLYVGIFLFFSTASPWLLIAGSRLLHPKAENALRPPKRKALIASGIISGFCFVAGLVTIGAGGVNLVGDMQVMNMSFTASVSAEAAPDTFPVVIEEDGEYQISYTIMSLTGAEGKTTFTLTGSDGTAYVDMTAESIFGNTVTALKAGDYTLTVTYDYVNTEPASANINFVILKSPG